MKDRLYLIISGAVFALISLLHMVQSISAWQFQIGPFQLQNWMSYIGFVAAGCMSLWAFQIVSQEWNTPRSMVEFKRIWGAWPTYFAFLVIGGLLSVLTYSVNPSLEALSAVLCGLAIGLIVGGITGLIHTVYLEKEINTVRTNIEMERLGERMYSVGIQDVFAHRPLKEIMAAIETAKYSIRIVGSSLKGLVGTDTPDPEQEAILNLILHKIKRGVNFRLLLAHPFVAGYRERMEVREHGSIPTEIIENLIRLLNKLETSKLKKPAWSIRLYECGPTVFCVEVDESSLFMEPYPLAGTSKDNLCLKTRISLDAGNLLRLFMSSHFANAWGGVTTEICQKTDLEPIVNELAKQSIITTQQQQKLIDLLNVQHS